MRLWFQTFKAAYIAAFSLCLSACSVGNLEDVTRVFFPDQTGNSALSFVPAVYDFGMLAAGSGSASNVFTITNGTGAAVYISSVSGGSNSDFTLNSDNCPRSPSTLDSGATCQASVTFAPVTGGGKAMSLVVVYGLAIGDVSLAASLGISGTGVSSLSFGGISNITAITATTLNVHWVHVAGAVRYFVYTVNAGVLTYVTDVTAPTAVASLTGLTPGTTYTFRVRALDALGVWDSNTVDVPATMLNPGTFTAISNMTSAEGATSYTANLSCTNMYGDTPAYSIFSQSDTDANCSITGAPHQVVCSPAYKTGHSGWSSTIVTRCILNAQVFDNTFTLTVNDTNRAPSLTAIGNQTTQITNAITAVNGTDANTSADTDSDLDALLYSCAFVKNGGASTPCSAAALTGTYSLNTSTGVLNWTPGAGAITGENNSTFVFTLTASDQQGAPLTHSQNFTITVTPINPVLTAVSNYTFANGGTQITIGGALGIDVNNIRDGSPGDDTNMSYACVYDKVVDGAVAAGTACSTLLNMSFNTSTGAMLWTPDYDAFGPYEFKLTGTNTISTLSGDRIFVADIRQAYPTANLLNDYDAQFADLTGMPTVASYAFWRDLMNLQDANISLFSSGGGWVGTGTNTSNHRLLFDGTGNVNLGQVLSGHNTFSFSTWISPASPTTASRVILGNGGVTGDGFTLRQASDGSGKLDMVVGVPFSDYQSLILADNPIAYWRLGEAPGATIAVDISGANYCSGAPCDATYTGGYTLGQTGNISGDADFGTDFNGTNAAVVLPQNFSFTGDFTLEAWVTTGATQGGSIFGSGSGNSDALGIQSTNLAFRFFQCTTPGTPATCSFMVNGATQVGASTVRHVALTRSATAVTLYIDGILDGTGTSSDVFDVVRIGTGTRIDSTGVLRYFQGKIDEVAFYTTALPATKIKARYDAGASAKYFCRTATPLAVNDWTAVTGTFASNSATLYLNGIQACTYTTTSTYDDAIDLYAGSTPTNTNYWSGRMGDLRLYSAAGVAAPVYNATVNRFRQQPLHALYDSNVTYKIDAPSAKDAVNPQATGCGNSRWVATTAAQTQSVLYGLNCTATSGWVGSGSTSDPYRLALDGTDDYVDSTLTSTGLSIIGGSTPKAIEVWAYLKASAGVNALFSVGVSPNAFVQLKTDAATNTWSLYGNGGTPITFTHDGHNKWTHFVSTNDGTTTRIYVNGAMLATGGGTYSTLNTYTLTIGRNDPGNGTDGTVYFNGDVAYAAVYTRDLVQAEVSALCNALKGRFSGVGAGVTCN